MLDRHSADFDAHNLFYLAVMGLLSAAERFDALLAQHGPTSQTPPAVDPRALDDPALCAALGLVALRENIRGHLGVITRSAPTSGVLRTDDNAPALRGLLR